MRKIILFDADGVIIDKPKLFSEVFSKEHNVSLDKILPFFECEMERCLVGDMDVKDALARYVDAWGWSGTIDELLEYWFDKEHHVNEQVRDYILTLRDRGVFCCLATNNEMRRVRYMAENMGFGKLFDQVLSSAHVKARKPERAFWENIHVAIGEPDYDNVLFWDDKQENVNSARDFGYHAERYEQFDAFKQKTGMWLEHG